MIAKKVPMLGSWGVGKTSLVRQIVENVFDDNYLSTLGVNVDKKALLIEKQEVTLMLWDVAGSENEFSVPLHYIKGASALILVVDRTRRESLNTALSLLTQVQQGVGELPFVIMANKSDLDSQLSDQDINRALASNALFQSTTWFSTSAKTGENVELAFSEIAKLTLPS